MNSCGNCLHGKVSIGENKIKCYNEDILNKLDIRIIYDEAVGKNIDRYSLVGFGFGCNMWAQKIPLNIQEVKIVSVSKLGSFAGYYIKHGSRYHKITTDRPIDFTPDLRELGE